MNMPLPARATRKKSRVKMIAWTIVILLLVSVLLCVSVSIYVGWSLTHPLRKPLTATPAQVQLKYSHIQFPSRTDHLMIKGWYIPESSGASKNMTLIFAHGYRGNRLETDVPILPLVKSLSQDGYNAVLFDFRNSGISPGHLTSVGEYEERDLLGAIDWTKSNIPGKIGLIGFSMGASTAIMAAADSPDVAGVVADSPFSDLSSYLSVNLSVWSHLPRIPFTPLIMGLLPPITGIHVDKVDPYLSANRVYPRPILFIHSKTDPLIPYTESERMYQEHPHTFKIWLTSGAGHIGSYKLDPEKYVQRVESFFGNLQQKP